MAESKIVDSAEISNFSDFFVEISAESTVFDFDSLAEWTLPEFLMAWKGIKIQWDGTVTITKN